MDTPPVTLGPVEQRRLYVLTELLAGRLTTLEAALTLEVSIRHLKRLKARYRREGVASLVHAAVEAGPGGHGASGAAAGSPGGRSCPR